MVKNPEAHNKGKRPGLKIKRGVIDFMSGDFLAGENVVRNLPFLFFISFLALLYIANGYVAEGTVRDINKLSNEMKELRSEYITTQSELMYTTKQSELIKILNQKEMGLIESFEPPKKIVVTKEERKQLDID